MQWFLSLQADDQAAPYSSAALLNTKIGAPLILRMASEDDDMDWEWLGGPGPWYKGACRWTWDPAALSYRLSLYPEQLQQPYLALGCRAWRFPINGAQPAKPWFTWQNSGAGQLATRGGASFTWLQREAIIAKPIGPGKQKRPWTFRSMGTTYKYTPETVALLRNKLKTLTTGPAALRQDLIPGVGTVLVPNFVRIIGVWSMSNDLSVRGFLHDIAEVIRAAQFAEQLKTDLVLDNSPFARAIYTSPPVLFQAERIVTCDKSRRALNPPPPLDVDAVVYVTFPPRANTLLPTVQGNKQDWWDNLRDALNRAGALLKSGGGLLPAAVQIDVKPALDMLGSALQGKGLAGGDPPDKDYEDAVRKRQQPLLNTKDVIDDDAQIPSPK
jgi:hypothetical protein